MKKRTATICNVLHYSRCLVWCAPAHVWEISSQYLEMIIMWLVSGLHWWHWYFSCHPDNRLLVSIPTVTKHGKKTFQALSHTTCFYGIVFLFSCFVTRLEMSAMIASHLEGFNKQNISRVRAPTGNCFKYLKIRHQDILGRSASSSETGRRSLLLA